MDCPYPKTIKNRENIIMFTKNVSKNVFLYFGVFIPQLILVSKIIELIVAATIELIKKAFGIVSIFILLYSNYFLRFPSYGRQIKINVTREFWAFFNYFMVNHILDINNMLFKFFKIHSRGVVNFFGRGDIFESPEIGDTVIRVKNRDKGRLVLLGGGRPPRGLT